MAYLIALELTQLTCFSESFQFFASLWLIYCTEIETIFLYFFEIFFRIFFVLPDTHLIALESKLGLSKSNTNYWCFLRFFMFVLPQRGLFHCTGIDTILVFLKVFLFVLPP